MAADIRRSGDADPARVARRRAANREMDAYAGGDASAFKRLYALVAPELWGYIVSRVGDRAHAEDLMQQTLLHMHRARGRYRRGANVHPWMFTIACRLVIDSHRRRRGSAVEIVPAGLVDPGPQPDEGVWAAELGRCLRTAYERLPRRQKAAFDLVRTAGLSHREAAEALGTTESAIKSLMHRALVSLDRSRASAEAP